MLLKAWAVTDGEVSAEVGRSLAWMASSGASGVGLPLDMKVRALTAPAGQVTIARGGAVVATTYPTALTPAESYVTASDGTDILDIPPTGSAAGGRTDYVILRVRDWHFDSSLPEPTDKAAATYCSFERVSSLDSITAPYIPLAKIVIPPNTTAITPSMITDLRKVANPRTLRVLRVNALYISETETLKAGGVLGENFPNAGGTQRIDIPSWATYMVLVATWDGLRYPGGGDCYGRLWTSWGDWDDTAKKRAFASQQGAFDFSTGSAMRADKAVRDYIYIPKAMRGRQNVGFSAMGRVLTSTRPTMDSLSSVSLDILFQALADPSDT